MQLDENLKQQIRHLVASPQWKTLQYALEIYVKERQAESRIGSTPTDTMVKTYEIDGGVNMLRHFFQQLIDGL